MSHNLTIVKDEIERVGLSTTPEPKVDHKVTPNNVHMTNATDEK